MPCNGDIVGGNNTIRRKRGERNKFRQLNPQQPRNRNNANGNADGANRNNDQANSAVANEAEAAATANAAADDGSQG